MLSNRRSDKAVARSCLVPHRGKIGVGVDRNASPALQIKAIRIRETDGMVASDIEIEPAGMAVAEEGRGQKILSEL